MPKKRTTTGTSAFGWCLDGLHDTCWVTNQGLRCTCSCHEPGDPQPVE
jgi:hypothetical protein